MAWRRRTGNPVPLLAPRTAQRPVGHRRPEGRFVYPGRLRNQPVPKRSETMSSRGRCTVRSIYLPDPSGKLRKTAADDHRILTVHPVTGKLVMVRSWKDLRDIERQAAMSNWAWDQLVVVTPHGTAADAASVAASLSGPLPDGWSRVVLDSEMARGRVYLPWLGPDEEGEDAAAGERNPASRMSMIERARVLSWLENAVADPERKELRRVGASQLSAQLFGDKVRKDIIRRTGEALLPVGPTGRFPGRRDVVALAALAADLLSTDRLYDVLGWPYAPTFARPAEAAEDLTAVLGPWGDTERWQLLEAFAVATHTSYGGYRYDVYDFDYDGHDEYDDYDDGDDFGVGDCNEFARAYQKTVNTYYRQVVGPLLRYSASEGVHARRGTYTPAESLSYAAALTRLALHEGRPLPAPRQDWEQYLAALVGPVPAPMAWQHPAAVAEMHGRPIPGWPGAVLELPTSADDLQRWGKTMNNCIGGYSSSVTSGSTIVVGVAVGGVIVANASLCLRDDYGRRPAWVIDEVLGRFNDQLPPSEEDAVRNLLADTTTRLAPHAVTVGVAVNPAAVAWMRQLEAEVGYPAGVDDALGGPDDDLADQADDLARYGQRVRRPGGRGAGVKDRDGHADSQRATSKRLQRRSDQAAVAAMLDNVADHVGDEIVAEVQKWGAVTPDAARQVLAMLATRSDVPDLDCLVAMAAVVKPQGAWLNPDTAAAARAVLEGLEGADPEQAATLAGALHQLVLFPAATAEEGMLKEAVRLWVSGRLGDDVVEQAWRRRAMVRLAMPDGSVRRAQLGNAQQTAAETNVQRHGREIAVAMRRIRRLRGAGPSAT
jgi:hypothetical protein